MALVFFNVSGPRLSRVCCEVAITMTLYGEVVKVLNKYWITPDQPEYHTMKLRSSSVISEVEISKK